ncbi:MAG: DUF3892 domain-containing protein [Bacteroidetes bacterium]|nr:DUF3892 domain-containing protein [Bacteroidota bacterium]
MKKILCVLAVFALIGGSAFSQELKTTKRSGAPITVAPAEPSKGAKAMKISGKSIKGSIVSVMSYCAGKGAVLTKDEASDMAKRGEMLGVVVGKNAKTGKLYLVCNADGTSALIKLANGGTITVTGKIFSKGGVNLITAEHVE